MACTRALALASFDLKDISDDVSEVQHKELDEAITFYTGKYPHVGILR